jgi:integrase
MARSFSRLRRAYFRELRPGSRISERGVIATKLNNGDVRWAVNVMVDGHRIHRIIGLESDGVTRLQAEQFIEKAKTDAREQRLCLPKGRKLSPSFETAAEIYLQRLTQTGGKDYVNNEQHLRLHLCPRFGKFRLDSISRLEIETFHSQCRKAGLSDTTVNRVLATLRRMGRKLVEWQMIKRAFPTPKLARERNERTRVISKEEEKLLLDAALADCHPYIWVFVKIGLATALRHSEILRMRFENFDPLRRRFRVLTKGGRWREQPLTRSIANLLVQLKRSSPSREGWVFPSEKGQQGHIPHLSAVFRRCVKRAGLDPRSITPHIMRHTAITRLASTGADIKTIQSFSGHESLEMIMRYAHRVDHAIDNALEKLDSTMPPARIAEMHYTKITPGPADAQPELTGNAPNEVIYWCPWPESNQHALAGNRF